MFVYHSSQIFMKESFPLFMSTSINPCLISYALQMQHAFAAYL